MSTVLAFAPKPETVSELIDEYMAAYAGRDRSIGYRLSTWATLLGPVRLDAITDDHVFEALERFASEPARIWAGHDADGRTIYRRRADRKSPATVNRYHVALSAVFTWAMRKRRVAKTFENPCRKIERQKESPGRVRFLAEDERARLFEAARSARWPRLYALVLLAVTTGARRSELTGLRWADIDFDRAEAHVHETKNDEPKVLPLVPAVLDELRRFQAEDLAAFRIGMPSRRVFHSRVRPDVAYNFEPHWRQALKDARVSHFRFHDLRHTCASYLAQSGASLLEIADVLGHRQLTMTKRYSHLTTGTKKALTMRVLGELK
ncbi:MAG: tyrosine-type recombinase/integrase [Betaproteobacteria bacterium]|nr:tyrosine-type recombinase/integrase [Betaproteobacteria bacterium]